MPGVWNSLDFIEVLKLGPFPDFLFETLDEADFILVPELNQGQLVREVQRAAYERFPTAVGMPIKSLGRVDDRLLTPERIAEALTREDSSSTEYTDLYQQRCEAAQTHE